MPWLILALALLLPRPAPAQIYSEADLDVVRGSMADNLELMATVDIPKALPVALRARASGVGENHTLDIDHQNDVVCAVDAIDVFGRADRVVSISCCSITADGCGASGDEGEEAEHGDGEADGSDEGGGNGAAQELAVAQV